MIKFRDSRGVPHPDRRAFSFAAEQIAWWRQIQQTFAGVDLERLYRALEPDAISALVAEARRRDPTYDPPDLNSYFRVTVPAEVSPAELLQKLRAGPGVEQAYLDPPGQEPQAVPRNAPCVGRQGYLDPAPTGIDARFAWTVPGGDGAGVQLIDLERGWKLDHEELAARTITLLHGQSRPGSRGHGTAVLGVICADNNGLGVTGIAPQIGAVKTVSYWGDSRANSRANMIALALRALHPGDVLLLEAEVDLDVGETTELHMPIELLDAEWQAMRLGTALGIVVVAAAGNGNHDLDRFPGLTRLAGQARRKNDSGAILVGAAGAATPHCRMQPPSWGSNFGSGIDCYAWGEGVSTCVSTDPFDTTSYWCEFNGTSSAAAIIAGAAVLVQSVAKAKLGAPYGTWQLRAILSSLGTATVGGPGCGGIGVMPDLRRILSALPPLTS